MNEFVHTKMGFCFWDIPSLIILLVIVAVFVVHVIRQKRREKEFEDEISNQSAMQVTRQKEEK